MDKAAVTDFSLPSLMIRREKGGRKRDNREKGRKELGLYVNSHC